MERLEIKKITTEQRSFLELLSKLSERNMYQSGHLFMIRRILTKNVYWIDDAGVLNEMGKKYIDWKLSKQVD